MKHGMVQVYTGEGKGKTTAALGLAMRAVGQGLRVCFIQFMKPADFETGEKESAKSLAGLTMVQFGDSTVWGKGKPKREITEGMRQAVRDAFEAAGTAVGQGHYDIIVLDEINIALNRGLVSLSEMMDLLAAKPANVELVLTGRDVPKEILEKADLVTEMVKVKHPYDRGEKPRKGIEF